MHRDHRTVISILFAILIAWGPLVPLAAFSPPIVAAQDTGTVTARGDFTRTGVIPGSVPEAAPELTWTAQFNEIDSDPVALNARVYLAADGCCLVALDAATGTEIWRADLGDSSTLETPTVVGDTVYVAGDALHAVDANTGRERWSYSYDPENYEISIDGTVVVTNETVIANVIKTPLVSDGAQLTSYIVTLDRTSGAELDSSEIPAGFEGELAYADGQLYFGCYDGLVYARDAFNDAEIWSTHVDSLIEGFSQVAVANGRVYLTTPGMSDDLNDSLIGAYDAATGDEIWTYAPVGDPAPLAVGDAVYVASGGQLFSLDAATGSGQWRTSIPEEIGEALDVFFVGDAIVVGGRAGFGVVNALSGEWRWTIQIEEAGNIHTTVGNDAIYVAQPNGSVAAYGPSDGADAGSNIGGSGTEGSGTATVAMAGGTAGGTGEQVGPAPSGNPQVRWQVSVGELPSSATVLNGVVYVGGGGNVYALDAKTGDEQWRYALSASTVFAPAVADGVVYASAYISDQKTSVLVALDAKTGAEIWKQPSEGRLSAAIVSEGKIVTLGGAFDAETGRLLWSGNLEGLYYYPNTPPISKGLVITNATVKVAARDASTGNVVWESQAFSPLLAPRSIIVLGDTVLVGREKNFIALDLVTGAEQAVSEDYGETTLLAASADVIVACGATLSAYATHDLSQLWKVEPWASDEDCKGPPSIAGNTVVVVGDDDIVRAFNMRTGAEEWQIAVEEGVWPPSVAIADGVVYVTSKDGSVYAIEGSA